MKTRTFPSLPCAASVPNLIADRAALFARRDPCLNVRRLMYQSLIWLGVVGHEPGRLRTASDAESLERLPDALVDGMRGDSQLDRNFLRRQMLSDEAQAIELPLCQPCHAIRGARFNIGGTIVPEHGIRHPSLPFKR